jgi:hypothetical protein
MAEADIAKFARSCPLVTSHVSWTVCSICPISQPLLEPRQAIGGRLFDLDQRNKPREECSLKLRTDPDESRDHLYKEIVCMHWDLNGLAELDLEVLTPDLSDEELERAAAVRDGQAITIGSCTHWWHCSWPM